MKLYLTPGTCAQGCHINLLEAGLEPEIVLIDIPTHRTPEGDFFEVNHKGYVPALAFDDGMVLTETTAVSFWAACQSPHLMPDGPDPRRAEARLIEALAFAAAEVHRPFMRMMFSPAEAEKAAARAAIEARLALGARTMPGDWLLGDAFSAADPQLWVLTGWALGSDMAVADRLRDWHARVGERPAVRRALEREGMG